MYLEPRIESRIEVLESMINRVFPGRGNNEV